MPDKIQVTVKTKTIDLFRFMAFHAYSQIAGMITLGSALLSLILLPIALLVWRDNFIALIFTLLIVFYLILTPLNMFSQAKRQVIVNPVFKNPIIYHISEEVFEVEQHTGNIRLYWHQLSAIKRSPFDYLFYVNKDQAFIMPKKLVGTEDLAKLEEILGKAQTEIDLPMEEKKKRNIEMEIKKASKNEVNKGEIKKTGTKKKGKRA
ncbi:MAG: YcxB family protein [Vallitaleaceae bacterium]|nr:YcxB family protein [Vallitaleaceae bacterium]